MMTYACPTWGTHDRRLSFEIAAPATLGSPHHWQFSKAHIGPRFSRGFRNFLNFYKDISGTSI
jgi:hypothetical protein